MPGFFDATCPDCGARIGWAGELKDRPPCPRCGHRPNQSELDEADRRFGEYMERSTEERDRRPFAQARRGKMLTLVGAARALGISPTHLSAIEHGRAEPSGDVLRRMADLYDVSMQGLGADSPQPLAPGTAAK